MDGFLGFRVFEWSGGVTDERRGEAGLVMMWKVGLRLVCCSTSGRDVCKFYFSGRWVPAFIIRKCAWGNWKAVFESDRHAFRQKKINFVLFFFFFFKMFLF